MISIEGNSISSVEGLEREGGRVINFASELARLFPDLPALVTDYINLILPTLRKNMESESMRFALIGSVYRRVIEGLDEEGILSNGEERIKIVQGRFRELSNATEDDLGEFFPLVLELARGPNDIDLKVGVTNGKITEVKETTFGRIFLGTAQRAMIYSGGVPSSITEKDKRRCLNCSFDEQEIECSFGQISTNSKRKNARIRFFQNGREIFTVDIGFYPGDFMGLLNDRRAGGQSVSKKQQGAIPLEIIEGNLSLVVTDPQSKVQELASPDDFSDQRIPEMVYPIDGEVEKLLRMLHVNLFHHKKLNLEEDVYRQIFNPRIWDWMEKVVGEAVETFSQTPPSLKAQQLFLKEIAVCLEEDPYLTLLIGEKIGLLKIFSTFSGTPIFLPRFLLTSDNFTFEVGEDGGFLPLTKRDQTAILRQRELFLESGVSGLRIVYDALFGGERRASMGEKITPEEFVKVMSCFGFARSMTKARHQLTSDYQKEIYEKVYSRSYEEIMALRGRKYRKKKYLQMGKHVLEQLAIFSLERIAGLFSYDDFESYLINRRPSWFIGRDESYTVNIDLVFNHLVRVGVITAIDKSLFFLTPPNVFSPFK